ncbi:phage major capsid protein [Tumebacillus flagellatus]|uniref:Phage capsid-like C-terminal domain-containing protein n=1 Tax=Tumebacillus flagellatus TaxID=1157490 RepID=A0A074M666_9BACL|nr:phage major capsid protein [Tumebacillus flagellatus]KEO81497.1 hypothetical protein EL26_20710 [Tumebacillus flagellatus]
MKRKLQEMLAKKEARKKELAAKADSATTVEELRGINAELETLNAEISDLRGMMEAAPDDIPAEPQLPTPEGRSVPAPSPVGGTKILATYGVGGGERREQEVDDVYGTVEYRKAFMEFAKTGKVTPELRADAMTTSTDVSAVVPTTILNEIIRKINVYGQIYARIRKLNIKGGVTVPILSLKPAATWIGENKPSDKQKVKANNNISFSYYGLECKVSTSLLADTVSLAGFESVITDLIVEAMVQAIDYAVIKGDGTGKPTGITQDSRVPKTQVVTLSPAEFTDWSAWHKKVFAKMPLAYKAGAAFIMASGTFEGYIDGMVDKNGQPVGRVNYGITEGAQERFGGKEVIQVEDDIVAPYDDAAEGEVVAVYCDLRNYAFNSNLQMTMYRYFWHDTNEWVDKAILIADGKLIDPYGVVIIKKGPAA